MTQDELIDREQIRDLLARYARACDRLDRAALERIYWPEATDDHGIFNGSASAFIDWAIPAMAVSKVNRHVLAQSLIELRGSSAAVETYFDSFHRIDMGGHLHDFFARGRYVDHMEKRDGAWRILRRKVVMDAAHGNPVDLALVDMLGKVATDNEGVNGADDPSVSFLALIPG